MKKLFLTVGAAALLSAMPKADLAVADSASSKDVSALNATVAGVAQKASNDFLQDQGHVTALLEEASEYYDEVFFEAPDGVEGEAADLFTKENVVKKIAERLKSEEQNARSVRQHILDSYHNFLLSKLEQAITLDGSVTSKVGDDNFLRKLAQEASQEIGHYNGMSYYLLEGFREIAQGATVEGRIDEVFTWFVENSITRPAPWLRFKKDLQLQLYEKVDGGEELLKRFWYGNNFSAQGKAVSSVLHLLRADKTNDAWIVAFKGFVENADYTSSTNLTRLSEKEFAAFEDFIAKLTQVNWDSADWRASLVTQFKPFDELKEKLSQRSFYFADFDKHLSVNDVHEMVIHQDFKDAVNSALDKVVAKAQEVFANNESLSFEPQEVTPYDEGFETFAWKLDQLRWAIGRAQLENYSWEHYLLQDKKAVEEFKETFKGVETPETAADYFKYNVYAAYGAAAEGIINAFDKALNERVDQLNNGTCDKKAENTLNNAQKEILRKILGSREYGAGFVEKLKMLEEIEAMHRELPQEINSWESLPDAEIPHASFNEFKNLPAAAKGYLDTLDGGNYEKLTTTRDSDLDDILEDLGHIIDPIWHTLSYLKRLSMLTPVFKEKVKEVLGDGKTLNDELAHEEWTPQEEGPNVQQNMLPFRTFGLIFNSDEQVWADAGGLERYVENMINNAIEVRQKMGEWQSNFKQDAAAQPLLAPMGQDSLESELFTLESLLKYNAGQQSEQWKTTVPLETRNQLNTSWQNIDAIKGYILLAFYEGCWDDFIGYVNELREVMEELKALCETTLRELNQR